jgi:hypothetical protein
MPPCDFSDPALDAFNEPKNLAFFFCRYIKGAQCGGEMSADARPVFLVDAQPFERMSCFAPYTTRSRPT